MSSRRQSHTIADLKILIKPVVLFADRDGNSVAGLKGNFHGLPPVLAVRARVVHVGVDLRCHLRCDLPNQPAVLWAWPQAKNSEHSVVTRAISVSNRGIVVGIDGPVNQARI